MQRRKHQKGEQHVFLVSVSSKDQCHDWQLMNGQLCNIKTGYDLEQTYLLPLEEDCFRFLLPDPLDGL
jgi:hypothetical protein